MAGTFLRALDGGPCALNLSWNLSCQLHPGILPSRAQVAGGRRLFTEVSPLFLWRRTVWPGRRPTQVQVRHSRHSRLRFPFLTVSVSQKRSHRGGAGGFRKPQSPISASPGESVQASRMLWAKRGTQLLLECGSVAFAAVGVSRY